MQALVNYRSPDCNWKVRCQACGNVYAVEPVDYEVTVNGVPGVSLPCGYVPVSSTIAMPIHAKECDCVHVTVLPYTPKADASGVCPGCDTVYPNPPGTEILCGLCTTEETLAS